MFIRQLTAFLSLMTGVWSSLPTSKMSAPMLRPLPSKFSQGSSIYFPPPGVASGDGPETLVENAQISPSPGTISHSWKTFQGLKVGGESWELLHPGKRELQDASGLSPEVGRPQEEEEIPAVSLPLSPKDVVRETCKAVPFTQVVSRPGCTSIRLQNKFCFGRCSSFYIPSAGLTRPHLCNSCLPSQHRRVSVVLWCQGVGKPSSGRRLKVSTSLVEACQCHTHV
ncbi:DAN domain family member 5 [Trichosurus vulpecula]|uniref:DAN domain family member 5 n=1 Tax=Trichosurus vulpecula TaxID=9337 RepID=UPI00186B2AEB|nr:DAN domain family member 5 [Trichosurus vulpecula]